MLTKKIIKKSVVWHKEDIMADSPLVQLLLPPVYVSVCVDLGMIMMALGDEGIASAAGTDCNVLGKIQW